MATDTYIISVKPPLQRIHNSAGGTATIGFPWTRRKAQNRPPGPNHNKAQNRPRGPNQQNGDPKGLRRTPGTQHAIFARSTRA